MTTAQILIFISNCIFTILSIVYFIDSKKLGFKIFYIIMGILNFTAVILTIIKYFIN